MKINELGSNKRKKQVDEGLDFGVGNWLLRKGAGGVARAALAQRDYLSSQAFKTELATFERAFNDAVAGEIIKLDPKVDDPVANGQIKPQQGQAQQGQAQQGQAQQGQAQTTQGQVARTGPIMSTDPDARSKLAAMPRQVPPTQTAQDAAARAKLTPSADPSRTKAYAQARGRQPTGPIMSNTPAATPLNTGPTGGKRVTPSKAPAKVQKLASPMTDQQLRDIEAKRQRMKEATDFETAFDILMEDSVLMESQSAADYARQYIEAKTHEFQDQIPPNYQQAMNKIYGEFAQEYDKTGKFPKAAATKLIKIVIALNQIVKRSRDSWGGTSYSSSTGTAQTPSTASGTTQGSTPKEIVTNAINQLKSDSQSGQPPAKAFVNAILILAQGVHDSNPQGYSTFVTTIMNGLKEIGKQQPTQQPTDDNSNVIKGSNE
jgi:hypothetical protein